jgi:hypothetical protein
VILFSLLLFGLEASPLFSVFSAGLDMIHRDKSIVEAYDAEPRQSSRVRGMLTVSMLLKGSSAMTIQRFSEAIQRFVQMIAGLPVDHFNWRDRGRTIGLTETESDRVVEEFADSPWLWCVRRSSIAIIDRKGFNEWCARLGV